MSDGPLTEGKLFHIIATVLGTLFLGICGYFAVTVTDTSTLIKVMAEHVANIDDKIDKGFLYEGKRLDDHELRIRELEKGRAR